MENTVRDAKWKELNGTRWFTVQLTAKAHVSQSTSEDGTDVTFFMPTPQDLQQIATAAQRGFYKQREPDAREG